MLYTLKGEEMRKNDRHNESWEAERRKTNRNAIFAVVFAAVFLLTFFLGYFIRGITESASGQKINEIIKIIDKAGHLKDTTFITFVPENIYGLRDILPNQSVQALTDRVDDMIMEGIVKYNVDIDVLFRALDEEKVKLLKSHGKIINCWTVDALEDASRMIDLGVDFITSNILE